MGLYWSSGHSRCSCSNPIQKRRTTGIQDTDETPETPLDEPRPPRVQDPPPQPDQKGPYVVQACKFS